MAKLFLILFATMGLSVSCEKSDQISIFGSWQMEFVSVNDSGAVRVFDSYFNFGEKELIIEEDGTHSVHRFTIFEDQILIDGSLPFYIRECSAEMLILEKFDGQNRFVYVLARR